MYTTKEELKRKEMGNWEVIVTAVCPNEGSHWFQDLYTESEHIAGTTIQDSEGRYWIGQCTPAELAKDYAKQGRENPSREAYESLQKELQHYQEAQDFWVECEIRYGGRTIGEGRTCSSDFSYVYWDCFEDAAQDVWCEYGAEAMDEAKKEAREFLAQIREAA